jgi:hypothetical protein
MLTSEYQNFDSMQKHEHVVQITSVERSYKLYLLVERFAKGIVIPFKVIKVKLLIVYTSTDKLTDSYKKNYIL